MRRNIPLITMIFFFSFYTLRGQDLVVSEFMAAPANGESEWIELCNVGAATVNVRDWTFEDAASGPVPLCGTDLYLAPGDFLVVTDALPLGARWRLPKQRLLHQPALPTLNNSGDDIILRRPDDTVADQLTYTSGWLAERGISVERRRLNRPNVASNWGRCAADSGATPGQQNSLAPAEYDLALCCAVAYTDSLAITVKNVGMQQPEQARIDIWMQPASSSYPELLGSESFSPPLPEDSVVLRTLLAEIPAGKTRLLLVQHCAGDTRSANDSLQIAMHVPIPRRALILNEIMYEPLATGCEWVEYVNSGDAALDLTDVRLVGAAGADGGRSGISISGNLPVVPGSGYVVIAADSIVLTRFPDLVQSNPGRILIICDRSSLGLGNTNDEIVLLNTDGSVIDSAVYRSDWHHPFMTSTRGRSLELLHPSLRLQGEQAWSSCTAAAGGTPGCQNSVAYDAPIASTGDHDVLQISPVPFSPDGDGFEDHCVIRYTLPRSEYQGRLRIYDATGRCIRSLLNNAPAGSSLSIVWDGLDDAGRRARIGPYIVLLELLDTQSNAVAVRKGVIVVAARL